MITRKQLCERWNVSLDTVDRLTKHGHLHPIKIGRLVRFREDDIQQYEDAHSIEVRHISKTGGCRTVRVIV